MSFTSRLARIPAWQILLPVGLLLLALGLVDYATRTDFDFLIFYLIPLFFITWRWGARVGYGFVVLGLTLHAAADRLTHPVYTYPMFFYWCLVEDFVVLSLFRLYVEAIEISVTPTVGSQRPVGQYESPTA